MAPLHIPEIAKAPAAEYAVAYTPSEADKIAAALLEMEGGCHRTGASGEQGCFQFLPSTWETYSTETLGYVAELNEENEARVVVGKIQRWLDEGRTPREIFLLWNQGHAGPCRKGINRHGVAYDSCAYAERGEALLKTE